jgi:hypothetical protein
MVHPITATPDVVIQSGGQDMFPDGVGYLSGRPVYTVYLPVGKRKRWILQYCKPGKGQRVVNEEEAEEPRAVKLTQGTAVKAPFPLVTYQPAIVLKTGIEYLMVHGTIDATGTFQGLQVIQGDAEDTNKQLLASLAQWQFRPATQDGRPLGVEVLLAVPSDRVE